MNKKRVLLTRKLHKFALDHLKRKYLVEVHSGKIPMPRKKLLEKIRNVDGLICFPYDKIDSEIIDSAKNLKTICTYSVGFDHIDIGAARKKKIQIGYTPDVLTNATADLTISLMLDVMRRVTEGDRIIRAGKWKEIYGAYDYVGDDIEGKTLGILGLGRIGKAVAKRAKAFDMKILYHNRSRISAPEEKSLGVRYASFLQLLQNSDVLSIHVPHTKYTERIINIKALRKMKKTGFLINTSRGKIIDEKDLISCLKKKEIAGAGLDVFESEPIAANHPLTKLDNVVLAPHIGSSTKETRRKMAEITIRNLDLGMRGKRPVFSV